MNTPQFTKGQTLFFLNKDNVLVQCEYVQHFRADIHVVLAVGGGRHWKETGELFMEKPEQA